MPLKDSLGMIINVLVMTWNYYWNFSEMIINGLWTLMDNLGMLKNDLGQWSFTVLEVLNPASFIFPFTEPFKFEKF